MVGRQFRTTTTTPIYTIATYTNATHITLDVAYGGATNATATYQIYNAFQEVPTDFWHLISVWDPAMNWQLHLNVSQQELNAWDAQRANSGQAYLVSARDYAIPSGQTIPVPRYEIWPHLKSAYVLPYLYTARPTDLPDTGSTLPRRVRGDLLLEMALAECALWPGPSSDKKNPYFDVRLAKIHEDKAEFMINELERQDDEVWLQNVSYSYFSQLPWSPGPFGDASWIQKHAV